MHVLRAAFESLGFSRIATFLGSGNVIFETTAKDVTAVDKKIERRLSRVLGRQVSVFIRTLQELKEIAALEPFDDSQIRGASVNVIFLARNLDGKSKAGLMALRTDTDGFPTHPREDQR
jgi:uncharacterized protein (DUF1697 family)